jgi:hypothetical protein
MGADEWENRAASRYEAVKSAVYLGWWEDPEFRTCAARLRNVSQIGALVLVALKPPAEASLWLCLAGTPPGEWVEVQVVSSEDLGSGAVRLRLSFAETCPYAMFEGAVLGRDPAA